MQQALQEGCLPFTVDEPFVLGYCYFDEQSHALHQSMNLIERLTGDRVNLLLTEMTSRAMLLLYQPKTRDERRSLRAVLETSQSILEKQNLMTVCLMEDAVPWTHIPLTGDWLLEQVNRTSPSSGELLVIEKKDTSGQGQPLPFGEEWSDALDSLKRLNEYLLTGQKDLYFDEEARLWTLVDFRQNLRQAKTVGSALMMSILHSVSNLPESSSLRMQLEQYSVNAVHVPQTIPAELHRYAESFFDLRGQNKNNRQRSLVIKVNEYIAAHLEGDLSLTAIADAVHFHPVYLSRIYKENAGVSISDYIASQRLDCACALLRTTSTAVSTIARKTGFTSSNYFSRWFRKKDRHDAAGVSGGRAADDGMISGYLFYLNCFFIALAAAPSESSAIGVLILTPRSNEAPQGGKKIYQPLYQKLVDDMANPVDYDTRDGCTRRCRNGCILHPFGQLLNRDFSHSRIVQPLFSRDFHRESILQIESIFLRESFSGDQILTCKFSIKIDLKSDIFHRFSIDMA